MSCRPLSSVLDGEKLQRKLRNAQERNQDYEDALATLRDTNAGLRKRIATQSALLLEESKLTADLASPITTELLPSVLGNHLPAARTSPSLLDELNEGL